MGTVLSYTLNITDLLGNVPRQASRDENILNFDGSYTLNVTNLLGMFQDKLVQIKIA
jgi:hypothetical protein